MHLDSEVACSVSELHVFAMFMLPRQLDTNGPEQMAATSHDWAQMRYKSQ